MPRAGRRQPTGPERGVRAETVKREVQRADVPNVVIGKTSSRLKHRVQTRPGGVGQATPRIGNMSAWTTSVRIPLGRAATEFMTAAREDENGIMMPTLWLEETAMVVYAFDVDETLEVSQVL